MLPISIIWKYIFLVSALYVSNKFNHISLHGGRRIISMYDPWLMIYRTRTPSVFDFNSVKVPLNFLEKYEFTLWFLSLWWFITHNMEFCSIKEPQMPLLLYVQKRRWKLMNGHFATLSNMAHIPRCSLLFSWRRSMTEFIDQINLLKRIIKADWRMPYDQPSRMHS